MIRLYDSGVYLVNGTEIIPENEAGRVRELCGKTADKEEARKGSIAWGILKAHNLSPNMDRLRLRFDAMASHDITYVGIIQTAKASGMERFPLPYVLTNCHNTLCAVGGTINEDDHLFGLSAAKKYGGIYVPPHMAVIHQYMREMHAGCGKMILGSDSHTRYGALGTMAIGEGGGELVKQLLQDTYDLNCPEIVAVYLKGKPQPFVGPQDIALAIIGAVFRSGYVKNKVLEFVGSGVASMSADFRNSLDVMTTETTCLSSVWRTDGEIKAFLEAHGRGEDYCELCPEPLTWYDGCVEVDLSAVQPMIALPFHPSNVYTIDELNENLGDILRETEKEAARVASGQAVFTLLDKIRDGKLQVQQGIIAGCAGGNYVNVAEAAAILRGKSCGAGEFSLSVYPSSQPVLLALTREGYAADLLEAGAVLRSAFCGPCFGAGDTPCNNGLSVRHTTRNFPNREGSKPGNGQMAAVALMDARSIAATALNGGILTSAETLRGWEKPAEYRFEKNIYENRVWFGYGKAAGGELVYGPNIKDWPELPALSENILLKVCAFITDPVTTTDELIPSGETSSYRSNPLRLAEFTLSRRDPEYVGRAKAAAELEKTRAAGGDICKVDPALQAVFDTVRTLPGQEKVLSSETEIGSVIYAVKPGDGSAREQAASCQRVLGGLANIAREYATKRYRSNVMNWGMLPFLTEEEPYFEIGDWIYVPGIRTALKGDCRSIPAWIIRDGRAEKLTLSIAEMTDDERAIIRAGCLMNYNRNR